MRELAYDEVELVSGGGIIDGVVKAAIYVVNAAVNGVIGNAIYNAAVSAVNALTGPYNNGCYSGPGACASGSIPSAGGGGGGNAGNGDGVPDTLSD